MYRLEERLCEPIDGHVQEAARAAPPRVDVDEQRVNRPAREAVGEKTRAGSRKTRIHSEGKGCQTLTPRFEYLSFERVLHLTLHTYAADSRFVGLRPVEVDHDLTDGFAHDVLESSVDACSGATDRYDVAVVPLRAAATTDTDAAAQ